MKKLLIIDLFNLIHRAYHALPKEFTDKDGNPTNAIYGVASMLINVLTQVRPDYVVAVLDTQAPTFRHTEFTGYKAHRRPIEDTLSVQIPKIVELVSAFGISTVSSAGYEADDAVATIASRYGKKMQVIMLSNDRDLWQMAGPNILVMLPSTAEWLGPTEVTARLGVRPNQVPDYKGLVGDPSDNIPGVHGVGGKTAAKLLFSFGSIEAIYQNINKVEPQSLRQKLIDGYEQAVMSKKLATLDLKTPVEFSPAGSRYGKMPLGAILAILEKYNFKSLIKRVSPDMVVKLDRPANDVQKGLFD